MKKANKSKQCVTMCEKIYNVSKMIIPISIEYFDFMNNDVINLIREACVNYQFTDEEVIKDMIDKCLKSIDVDKLMSLIKTNYHRIDKDSLSNIRVDIENKIESDLLSDFIRVNYNFTYKEILELFIIEKTSEDEMFELADMILGIEGPIPEWFATINYIDNPYFVNMLPIWINSSNSLKLIDFIEKNKDNELYSEFSKLVLYFFDEDCTQYDEFVNVFRDYIKYPDISENKLKLLKYKYNNLINKQKKINK